MMMAEMAVKRHLTAEAVNHFAGSVAVLAKASVVVEMPAIQ